MDTSVYLMKDKYKPGAYRMGHKVLPGDRIRVLKPSGRYAKVRLDPSAGENFSRECLACGHYCHHYAKSVWEGYEEAHNCPRQLQTQTGPIGRLRCDCRPCDCELCQLWRRLVNKMERVLDLVGVRWASVMDEAKRFKPTGQVEKS